MKKGYALHPGVLQDLREIHAYIAQDSLDAADQVFDDIMERIRASVTRLSTQDARPRPRSCGRIAFPQLRAHTGHAAIAAYLCGLLP